MTDNVIAFTRGVPPAESFPGGKIGGMYQDCIAAGF